MCSIKCNNNCDGCEKYELCFGCFYDYDENDFTIEDGLNELKELWKVEVKTETRAEEDLECVEEENYQEEYLICSICGEFIEQGDEFIMNFDSYTAHIDCFENGEEVIDFLYYMGEDYLSFKEEYRKSREECKSLDPYLE